MEENGSTEREHIPAGEIVPGQPAGDTVKDLRRRYAAAQFAAAHSNSRFSTASRQLSEIRAHLEELKGRYESDQQYIRLLAEEKSILESELIDLRGRNQTLEAEISTYQEIADRAVKEAKAAAGNLTLSQTENMRLQQQLQQKDAQLSAIINSASFRLGRSATGIVRRIPGLSRRA